MYLFLMDTCSDVPAGDLSEIIDLAHRLVERGLQFLTAHPELSVVSGIPGVISSYQDSHSVEEFVLDVGSEAIKMGPIYRSYRDYCRCRTQGNSIASCGISSVMGVLTETTTYVVGSTLIVSSLPMRSPTAFSTGWYACNQAGTYGAMIRDATLHLTQSIESLLGELLTETPVRLDTSRPCLLRHPVYGDLSLNVKDLDVINDIVSFKTLSKGVHEIISQKSTLNRQLNQVERKMRGIRYHLNQQSTAMEIEVTNLSPVFHSIETHSSQLGSLLYQAQTCQQQIVEQQRRDQELRDTRPSVGGSCSGGNHGGSFAFMIVIPIIQIPLYGGCLIC